MATIHRRPAYYWTFRATIVIAGTGALSALYRVYKGDHTGWHDATKFFGFISTAIAGWELSKRKFADEEATQKALRDWTPLPTNIHSKPEAISGNDDA